MKFLLILMVAWSNASSAGATRGESAPQCNETTCEIGVYSWIDGIPAKGLYRLFDFRPRDSKSCAPTGVDHKLLGKVRHQGRTNWCFANVAADIFTVKTGKRISAAGIAIAQFSKNPMSNVPNSARGGDINEALIAGKLKGLCLEEDLPSEIYEKTPEDSDIPIQLYQEYLLSLESVIDEIEAKGFEEDLTCGASDMSQKLFPGLGVDDIVRILTLNGDMPSKVSAFADASCKGEKIKIEAKSIRLDIRGRPPMTPFGQNYFPAIDTQLAEGNPVAISVDAANLFKMNASAYHEMLIVNREFRAGKCGYLIRNSWGENCGASIFPCEGGYIWVPEEQLANHLRWANYLE